MTDEIAELPHNDEAENACLAAVLVDNRFFAELSVLMSAEDIYRPSARVIWETMAEMAARGEAIDQITLSDRLHQRGMLDAIGGPNALLRLQGESWTTNAAFYARIVREKAQFRKLYRIAGKVASEALTEAKPLEQLTSEISTALGKVQGVYRPQTKGGSELARGLKESMKAAISGHTAGGTSTGLAEVDALLGGGVIQTRLYLWGGLTKMGKTTIAISIAAHLLFKEGWAVDFVSCEMGHDELSSKFAGWLANVDVDAFVEKQRQNVRKAAAGQPVNMTKDDEAEMNNMADAVEALRLAPLFVTLEGRPMARDIALMARARQMDLAAQGRDPNKYLLVVDYLQACQTGNPRHQDSDRISECSQTLNAIAKDLKIPVFVIFQFDKKADDDFDQYGAAPSYARLKGSSQPAQDANHLLILHRPLRLSTSGYEQKYTEIVQELSRHGRGGERAALKAELATCHFETWKGEPLAAPKGRGGDRGRR